MDIASHYNNIKLLNWVYTLTIHKTDTLWAVFDGNVFL